VGIQSLKAFGKSDSSLITIEKLEVLLETSVDAEVLLPVAMDSMLRTANKRR
jgi:hypothetical protein